MGLRSLGQLCQLLVVGASVTTNTIARQITPARGAGASMESDYTRFAKHVNTPRAKFLHESRATIWGLTPIQTRYPGISVFSKS